MNTAGHQNSHGRVWNADSFPADQQTQRDLGTADAVAEERQRRLEDDRGRDQQRRRDDHDADGVGEDVLEDDARVRGTGDARRLDELALPQRQELRAHEAGDAGPREEAEEDREHDAARGRRPRNRRRRR